MTITMYDKTTTNDLAMTVLPQAGPTALIGPDGSQRAFGNAFTASMAAAFWTEDEGWSEPEFTARRPLIVDPAAVGLHYGQSVFEGLKAYRLDNGRLAIFRLDAYGQRMRRSAQRLALPQPPMEIFTRAVAGVAARDQDWLPDLPDASLYLRPILFATEPTLALRSARHCTFLVLAFVTGGFFSNEPNPITVKIEPEFVRAVRGGTGAAKYAGNYAPTFLAQSAAAAEDSQQVVWLDAVERRYVEELGGMNIFFVIGRGADITISTPPLNDTILPGITRDTVIQLSRRLGYRVEERPMDVADWRAGAMQGTITESFACGTAATITPIGTVADRADTWQIGTGGVGPATLRIRQELRDAWLGRTLERDEWLHEVGDAI